MTRLSEPRSVPGARWGGTPYDEVPLPLARAVFLTPATGSVLLLGVYLASRPTYYLLLREDQVVEWSQFGLCLLASVVAALATARWLHRGGRLMPALLLLVALGCLALCLEEISWGQRVLALHTPDAFAAVNEQQELNLHNVELADGFNLQAAFKGVSFAMGLVGAAWAVLARPRHPIWDEPRFLTLAPPTAAVPGFIGMVLYWPAVLLLPQLDNPITAFQEWAEAGLYLSLALTIVCIYRRTPRAEAARSAPSAAAAGDTSGVVVLLVLAFAFLTTVVCAGLTAYHGIVPGNVIKY